MEGRRLVLRVFEEGEAPRPPLHFESVDKEVEARLSDIILGHGWVPQWSGFFEKGGPFTREGSVFEWAEALDLEAYEWPPVDEVVEASVKRFEGDVKGRAEGKYVVFEVIGPTEQSEYFLMPPRPGAGRELDLSWHRFDFALLYRVKPEKAAALYSRVSKYILELVKAAAEMDYVDAVRVADDMAAYTGPIYPKGFYRELYLPWHRRFTDVIRGRGKHAILHCDGNHMFLLEELSELYDALHPIDFHPKSSVDDALRWAEILGEARARSGAVFFTGIPIDLLMDPEVGPGEMVRVVSTVLEAHGPRKLVLASTHRPYPGRSYTEPHAMEKIEAIIKLVRRGG